MKKIFKGISCVTNTSGSIAVVCLYLLFGLILGEIVARTFFQTSLVATLEISEWLLAAIVLMGGGWTLTAGGHVRIQLLTDRFSPRVQGWIEACTSIIGAIVLGLLAYYLWQGLMVNYDKEVTTRSFMWGRLWWAWLPLFVGAVVFTIQYAANAVNKIISLKTSESEREKGLPAAFIIALGVIFVALVGCLWFFDLGPQLSPVVSLLVILVILFLLVFGGVWIFMSLIITGLLALLLFTSYPPGIMAAKRLYSANASWVLTCLPLFILMGELLFHSGASDRLYTGISVWVERVPGRLLHSNILACTFFAAISGSSAATAATIGSVAIPELRKRGYAEGISLGSLAGAGTLGLLIPPSIVLIVYGAVTAQSIGQLFLAGIIPGLILSTLFMAYIAFYSIRHPEAAPSSQTSSGKDLLMGVVKVLPTVGIILLVLGGIYAGLTTPTEAAAIGAFCGLIACVFYKNLNWKNLRKASFAALRTSCMIMFVMTGAAILSTSVAYLRIPQELTRAIVAAGLSKYAVLAILCVIYLGLGCLFDGVAMMVMTLPIVFPLMCGLGFNGIWFGVVLTILIEAAQVTPPVGFNLYVLQTISGRDIGLIVRNTIPFFLIMLVGILLLVFFPEIPLILPKMMIG